MAFKSIRVGKHIVNQSGVRTFADPRTTVIIEAVVLSVHYPDDEDRIGDQRCITCDVRTIGLQSRSFKRVPVFQYVHGLWDEDTYVPRATAQHIGGGSLQTDASDAVAPTPAELCDGDHVLLGFLDGSLAKPFIWPVQVPHPATRAVASSSDGRKRRIRHHGTLIEIDKNGSITIDARGAAKQELGPLGTEVSTSGTGGAVTIVTKSAVGLENKVELDVSGKVTVTGAEVTLTGPAATPDVLTKYTSLAAAMNTLQLAVTTWLATHDPAINPGAPPSYAAADITMLVTLVKVWQQTLLQWALPAAHTSITKGG